MKPTNIKNNKKSNENSINWFEEDPFSEKSDQESEDLELNEEEESIEATKVGNQKEPSLNENDLSKEENVVDWIIKTTEVISKEVINEILSGCDDQELQCNIAIAWIEKCTEKESLDKDGLEFALQYIPNKQSLDIYFRKTLILLFGANHAKTLQQRFKNQSR